MGETGEADRYADFDAVYLDNVTRLHRLLFSKVGNRPDTEDLVAEVFLAALRPLRLDASQGEVRAYLLATARTVLAGFWRRRLGVEVTAIDLDTDRAVMDPGRPVESDAPDQARALLAGLPERSRRVLELRFLEARSLRETAQELDVTVGHVKVLQHRALKMAAAAGEGWEL